MMKTIVQAFIVLIGAACFVPNLMGKELVYVASNFPPYHEHQEESIDGIDVAIVKKIAERLKVELKIRKCPFMRCLLMLEEGSADITGTLVKKPDREKFLYFIDPPYLGKEDIVFYVSKGNEDTIQSYEDLYKLKSIGVVKGAKHFDQFDQDAKLRKKEVSKRENIYQMLSKRRLGAVIGFEITSDYVIGKEGLKDYIEKAKFRFSLDNISYFTVSKKSIFVERIPEISKIIEQMLKSGEVQEIINKYSRDYGKSL